MNKNAISVLLLFFSLSVKAGSISIRGYSDDQSDRYDSVTLMVWDGMPPAPFTEYKVRHLEIKVRTTFNGFFRFVLTGISGPVYFSLGREKERDRNHNFQPIMAEYLAEPGDSVTIVNFGHGTMDFYGRGSLKYRCRYELEKHALYCRFSPICVDSVGQMEILTKYSGRLSARSYAILRADIEAQAKEHAYQTYIEKNFGMPEIGKALVYYDEQEGRRDSVVFTADKVEKYRKWSAHFLNGEHADLRLCAYSRFYLHFLLEKEYVDSRFLTQGIAAAYGQIKQHYTGQLRDELLVDYFEDRGMVLPDAGTLLEDALSVVTTPDCRDELRRLSATQSKGHAAFNFSLSDTGGRLVNLSDFKGKVVFVDFWFTGCHACRGYYQEILSKAEERLKDNADVVFVTISIDADRSTWLRSISERSYTNPDVVNLNTGGVDRDAEVIRQYGVNGYPHPILIDREGKIFSNSFDELRGQGLGKLLDTIDSALAKK